MIYFDNAATGGFKPHSVYENTFNVIKYLSANPGRSGHRLSLSGAELVFDARKIISQTFNLNLERVIFTKNCTEALNTAILGSLKIGGHVITTVYEHNSVLRPLSYLQNKGLISLDVVSDSAEKSLTQAIEEKICPATYMIIANGASNVTGEVLPIQEIGNLCHKKGILFLVDGAQLGGHEQIDMRSLHIDMLCLAGHKGLYGIMGSGLLLLSDAVNLTPLTFGGTGTESFNLNQPSIYPERLESGTLNLPAIASLLEGVKYVKNNYKNFGNTLLSYTTALTLELKQNKKIKLYSKPNKIGIVSFSIRDIPSVDVADTLNTEYDIAVRGGLHCAPLMHKFLKTEKEGLVRVSLAVQNSTRELAFLVRALNKICGN